MQKAWEAIQQFNRDHGKAFAVIVALVVGYILGKII